MKRLTWLADSRSHVKRFPASVQDDIGYASYIAQLGETGVRARPLHGLGAGVMEIAVDHASGTFRAVYTVSIGALDLCDTCLSEKVQNGDRYAEVRDGPDPERLKQLRSEVKNAKEKDS